jgi:DNA (cytosine-5)-methyltransferase 1
LEEFLVYTVGDMFAGIGGMALGFEQAGFEVKWANEYDSQACHTYRYNFPSHKLYEVDVSALASSELGYVDVITSGFPCQAFSIAGYRKGFKDPRGNLFFQTAKFINEIKPKAYLLENVANLKRHDNGNTFSTIKNVLVNELGYSFIPFVLNGYIHGNVPQNRNRIYIVGFRDEAEVLPGGQVSILSSEKNWSNNSCTSNFKIPKRIILNKKISDLLYTEKQEEKYYFEDDHKYIPKLNEVMKSKETIYQWRRVYVRENKNNLCPTLTANMGTGGHNVPLIVDDYGYRKLTPRECFRFQGFPDSYKFPNGMSDSSLYKQIGNSVIVPIINRIASNIEKALNYGYNTS